MILIADSGSTKTDWAWVEDGVIVNRVETGGINPVHQSKEDILGLIRRCVDKLTSGHENVAKIYFYGAGCIPGKKGVVEEALREVFPQVEQVVVESDLLGAARAVCQHEEGIACILGTGSNSCLYDGKDIVANIPPLGYILGDEGSGAVLGKLFLNALFKGILPGRIKEDFLRWSGLTYPDIIDKVYRQPMANRFLASTSLYIGQHLEEDSLRELVRQNFRQFFEKNIAGYQRSDLPIGAIGSVAFHYQDLLREVAVEEGFMMGTIAKSPMEGLVASLRS